MERITLIILILGSLSSLGSCTSSSQNEVDISTPPKYYLGQKGEDPQGSFTFTQEDFEKYLPIAMAELEKELGKALLPTYRRKRTLLKKKLIIAKLLILKALLASKGGSSQGGYGYGPSPPSKGYGPPPKAPEPSYGPPPEPSYGPPPQDSYGPPPAPQQGYGR